jgi:outer membrane protein OmpA-like peptidoglycan-associated protein
MKKLLLGVLLIASAVSFTNAQTTQAEASKWSFALKGGLDYFRVTPTSTTTNKVFGSNTLARYVNDASWGAGVSIEKTLNPLFGLGLSVDYLRYNRNTTTGYTIDPTLFGSVNLTNLLLPHRSSAKFNLYTNLGVGAAFYTGEPINTSIGTKKSSISPVGTSGLLAEWNLSRKLALGVEGGYRTYLRENLGGTVTPEDKDKNNDAWTGLVSLRFKLGSLASHVRDMTMDQFYPVAPPVEKKIENPFDDSALKSGLDNASKRLGDIEGRLAALEQGLKDLSTKEEGTSTTVSFQNIEFEFDSDKLTDASYSTLNEVVSILKNNTSWGSLTIKGNTDNVGPDAYNQKLSEKRANTVKKYLASQGISESKLSAVGYGETKPIASNDTAEGRQQNRRVDFEIVK